MPLAPQKVELIDEALSIVRSGLQQQPKSFDLRLSEAGLLEAKGEYESAISEYESMLKDQPESMIVANNLASSVLVLSLAASFCSHS